MSTKINKIALPGIPDSKWDICQYNEIDYLPETGSTPAYPGMICPVGGDLFLSGYFGENTDTLAWTRLNLNIGETRGIADMQTVYNNSSAYYTDLTFTNYSNFAECDDVWLPLGKQNSYPVQVSGSTAELSIIWNLIKCLALITYHAGYQPTTGGFDTLRTQAFSYVDNGSLNQIPMPRLIVNGLALANPVCRKITYGREVYSDAYTYGEEYLDFHFETSFGYLILRAYRNNLRIRLGFELYPCTAESVDGYDFFGINSPSLGTIDTHLNDYAYYTSQPNKAIHRFLRKNSDLHKNYNMVDMAGRTPSQFWWCHPLLFKNAYGIGYQAASCKRFLRLDLFDEILNTTMSGRVNSDGYYTMAPLFDEIVRISPDKKNALVEYVIDKYGTISDSQWAPHHLLTNPITYPSELLYKYRVGTRTTTTTTTTSTTTTTTAPLVNYHIGVLNHYGDPLSSDEQTKCSATIYDTYGMPIQSVQCESTNSLHFYQIGGTRMPSYIVVIYQGMSKTISNLNTTTSSEYVVDFSQDIEFVRYTYNLVPHVLYQGQEVRTYQIGQYADYNFDEADWENRFTTDGMDVCDYDNISQQNGVDSFVVYEKHPNKVFIIPYGVSGMAESYGPIWIPETAGDIHHFEIELDDEQQFAPDLH